MVRACADAGDAMSLILEALRKSEAERRVGRPPGLLSPMPAAHRTPRPAAPWPLLAAGFAALLLVAAGAWWLGRHAAPADPAVIAGATDHRDGDTGPDSHAVPDATAVPPDTRAVARDDAARTAPVARPLQPGEFPPPPMSGDGPMERESRAQTAAQVRLPAAPASASAASRPAASDAAAPAARPAAPDAATPAPPPLAPAAARADVAPQAPVSPAATAASAPAAVGAPLETLPRVADLDPATRERLPPLKVSMHVFADAPAARFVLIDGRRLAEGDRVAHGITVDEIRRDGTVLRLDDRRILLPRP